MIIQTSMVLPRTGVKLVMVISCICLETPITDVIYSILKGSSESYFTNWRYFNSFEILHHYCMGHYTNIAQIVGRHKDLLNQNIHVGSPDGPLFRPYEFQRQHAQLWNDTMVVIRHNYNIAPSFHCNISSFCNCVSGNIAILSLVDPSRSKTLNKSRRRNRFLIGC